MYFLPFSWLHFIYGDREQALHNLNIPEYKATNNHEHDEKYQQLFKFMRDNENNLREGGRSDHEMPLNLKVCSSNEHNNNLKEALVSKTPPENEHRLQEDSSFQNTNFVRIKYYTIALALLN